MWKSVKDELPETNIEEYPGTFVSKTVPVKVDGFKDWKTGRLIKAVEIDYIHWNVEWCSGDYEVTHWFDNPEL